MLYRLIIVFLCITGVVCEEEFPEENMDGIYKECEEVSGSDKHFELTNVPDSEELKEKCPMEVEYFRCLSQKMEENDWDESFITYVRNVHKLLKDICEEDSDFHKEYVSSVPCYRMMEKESTTCLSQAKEIYKTHYQLIGHEEPEDVDTDWIEIEAMCMLQSVAIACLSGKAKENCDEVAYSMLSEMVNRTQYLRRYCSPDLKNVLQTSLLSSLDLDSESEEVYKNIFDII